MVVNSEVGLGVIWEVNSEVDCKVNSETGNLDVNLEVNWEIILVVDWVNVTQVHKVSTHKNKTN